MSSTMRRNQAAERSSHSRSRPRHHYRLAWLFVPLLLVAAMPVVLYARTQGSAGASNASTSGTHGQTAQTQPADQFMHSLVTEDGALGWRQLCPNIQAQLPQDGLVPPANAMRPTAARAGVWLTVGSIGTHSQPDGEALHVYRVTMPCPTGTRQQRTYSVLTQSSGCVEDVQTE